MSEMTPEYVSGRAFDEVSDMYEVTLKQLEAAKAEVESLKLHPLAKRLEKCAERNSEYINENCDLGYQLIDLKSQLAAEKAKSAKLIKALAAPRMKSHLVDQAIKEYEAGNEVQCICGEINARHCPVHNEVQG